MNSSRVQELPAFLAIHVIFMSVIEPSMQNQYQAYFRPWLKLIERIADNQLMNL